MALFNRKPKNSVLPEVDKYYEGERRDRSALAWLLALVSIAAVALVIVGLFFAGRWIYDRVTDDTGEVATTDTETQTPNFDGTPEENNGDNTPEETPRTDTEQPAPQPSTPTPTAPTSPSTTPATGDDGSELPSTGAGNLAAVFIGTTSLAGGIHYAVTRKRNS